MPTTCIGDMLKNRTLQNKKSEYPIKPVAINPTVYKTKALPAEIERLVQDKNYLAKYRKMITDGYLDELLVLTTLVETDKRLKTLDQKQRYFAKSCAKAVWQNTLDMISKSIDLVKRARKVAEKLGDEVGRWHMWVAYKCKATDHMLARTFEDARSPRRLMSCIASSQ